MDKTTVLDLNKPNKNDMSGHWDVPVNENADLLDAEASASRTELIGSTATPITGLLKGSKDSLAARLNVALGSDGSIDFNSGDLEKSRYSGLDYNATFPLDDIYTRLAAMERRLMVMDGLQNITSGLPSKMNRWTEDGFNPGAQTSITNPNMAYRNRLTIGSDGTNILVALNSGSPAEFVIAGNYYNLKRPRTIACPATTKGILYATVPGAPQEVAGRISDSGAGTAIGASVYTVTLTSDLAYVEDGHVLIIQNTISSPNKYYRYKVREATSTTITIYGQFEHTHSSGINWKVVAPLEVGLSVTTVPITTDIANPSETGDNEFIALSMLYNYGATNNGDNDRVPLAFISGTDVYMYTPRIISGSHTVHWGAGTWNGVSGRTVASSLADIQPKSIIPFIVIKDTTAGALSANVIFNPVELQTSVLHPAFTAYLTKEHATVQPDFIENFTIRMRRGSTGSMLILVGDDETVEIGNVAGDYSWGVIVSY